ncbi:helix-turn-helix domain-containing protein [Streptosporangium canum]|uniref:helix-turn-helix domain-containing protein n=1 Tax=Streptosporangium canum TaxID=324952 RepID=UPI00343B4043
MRKAYVFRLYPTAPQQVRLAAMLAARCELYNAALEERREAYRKRGVTVKVAAQMAQLTEISSVDAPSFTAGRKRGTVPRISIE